MQDPEREWNLLSSPPDMLYQIQTYYMALFLFPSVPSTGPVLLRDVMLHLGASQIHDKASVK